MMPAIADRSTMPLWPWWVWALLLAAGIVVVLALHAREARRHARRAQLVTLPSGRAVSRCWTHACPYPGVVPVFDRHAGVELEVCVGCAHDGVARGYYRLLPKRAA